MTTPDEIRELISRLARPAAVLSDADERRLACLASAVVAFGQQRWDSLIRGAASRSQPLLYCYASDGWSRFINSWTTRKVDGVLVKRVQRIRAEFNLERELLKTIDAHGLIEHVVSLSPPRPSCK